MFVDWFGVGINFGNYIAASVIVSFGLFFIAVAIYSVFDKQTTLSDFMEAI